VPAALTAYLGFRSGGFFPGAVGLAALVLLLALVLRLTLAARPWAGWSRTASVAAGALALFAVWILVSALWSHTPGRALLDFDRALLYLAVFALCALAPRGPGDLALALRLALGAIVVIAGAGLATRLYPVALGHVPPRDPARLAWPLTYWNAFGVCCALGTVLALHAASGRDEPPVVRVLAGAALPLLAVAGYFSFSRGAIAVAAIGLVAYVVLALPRRLPLTLATGGMAAAVALHVAYGAGALASTTYFRGAGPEQGRHVALAVVLAGVLAAAARAALLGVEARLDAVRIDPVRRRRALVGVATAAAVLVVSGAWALDAPARLHAEARRFTEGNYVSDTGDLRNRLGDIGNNGRLALWRVDLDAFRAQPLHGLGAGMYRSEWERLRPVDQQAVDGHSLYLETLGELGVAGLVLLVVFIGAVATGMARGSRGRERHARAALLAAGLALLLHAGLDWDWEMPVLFAWLVAAGGIACARPPRRDDVTAIAGPARRTRVIAGLAVLVLAVTPALVWRSQEALAGSDAAFARGDCATAVDEALRSASFVAVRPEPYEILGYCDLRHGADGLAVAAMRKARARDPHDWRYAYGLALARAVAGEDPRPAARAALALDPREPEARTLARALRGAGDPAAWRAAGTRADLPGE
jgi:hypothetical protein